MPRNYHQKNLILKLYLLGEIFRFDSVCLLQYIAQRHAKLTASLSPQRMSAG